MDKSNIRNHTADFLIFTKEVGGNGIEVRVENETIWLTQKLMAELFDTTKQNISLHLKGIFNLDFSSPGYSKGVQSQHGPLG